MTAVQRGDVTLHVETFGDPASEKTPLLLIHPINTSGPIWADVVAAFSGERFVIVPDMSGFGASSTADEYSLELWAADCLAAVDSMGVEQFHAVGGSLGGTIAAWLGGTYPERVASVMPVGSPIFTEGGDRADVLKSLETMSVPEMFAEIIPKYSLGPNASPEVIEKTLATCNPNGPDDVRAVWIAAGNSDARAQAAAVTAPATVVVGEFDLTCPPEEGKAFAEVLRAPLFVMPGIGHLPMTEDPDALIALIRAHLERAEAAA